MKKPKNNIYVFRPDRLTRREREIFISRLNIETFASIGERMSVSRERVRQVLWRAIIKTGLRPQKNLSFK